MEEECCWGEGILSNPVCCPCWIQEQEQQQKQSFEIHALAKSLIFISFELIIVKEEQWQSREKAVLLVEGFTFV